jgi:two-component system sensor kinase FixL
LDKPDLPESIVQAALDHVPALVAVLDPGLRYLLANRAHFTWFGLDPAALPGRHACEVVGEEAYAVLEPHYREAQTGEQSAFIGDVPFACGGGRYIHGTAVAVRGSGVSVESLLVLATDLSEYRNMERALDAYALRARTVLDTAVDGIITIDDRGVIQSFNPGAERLFGYSAREVIGQNVKMLMPAMYAAEHDGYLRRYLETGERRIIGIGREVTARHKDGTEIPIDLSVGEFVDDGRHYFTGFTRDIRDRKRAELEARRRFDQLAHVARRSAMGNLAAGIAHEVNQPLTAIVALSQALLRNLRAGRTDLDAAGDVLEKISAQGQRASAVIHQVREFIGQGNPADREVCNLADLIRSVLQFLDHEIGVQQVRVRLDAEPEPVYANVNRIQIEQVLLNLVQNSIEAMAALADGKVLALTLRRLVDEGGLVEVAVCDNGAGLPQEGERRIFESFFTTKPHGMGQGLSICRAIVESHGGRISAERNDGRPGATFRFTLPVAGPEGS